MSGRGGRVGRRRQQIPPRWPPRARWQVDRAVQRRTPGEEEVPKAALSQRLLTGQGGPDRKAAPRAWPAPSCERPKKSVVSKDTEHGGPAAFRPPSAARPTSTPGWPEVRQVAPNRAAGWALKICSPLMSSTDRDDRVDPVRDPHNDRMPVDQHPVQRPAGSGGRATAGWPGAVTRRFIGMSRLAFTGLTLAGLATSGPSTRRRGPPTYMGGLGFGLLAEVRRLSWSGSV